MRKRLYVTVFLSAVCLGLAATQANAGSLSSFHNLSLRCNGTTQDQTLLVNGFPKKSTQYIVGGAVTLTANIEKLSFLLLQSAAGDKATILAMGPGDSGSARFAIPVSFPVTADASGIVSLKLSWRCTAGTGNVTGFAITYFSG